MLLEFLLQNVKIKITAVKSETTWILLVVSCNMQQC